MYLGFFSALWEYQHCTGGYHDCVGDITSALGMFSALEGCHQCIRDVPQK